MSAVLTLSDLAVIRDGNRILDGINWVVNPEERWVILGPNGAGKTTLLSIASANIHPTEGSAVLLDEKLGKTDVFELRPRIGFAWNENYDLVDSKRATRVLAEWKLDHLQDRRFGTLSDGEQKRTQIARAVMTDPELLLLDEPAASLDLGSREELVGLLGAYAQNPESPAMVMVTHHVEEIPVGFTHAMLLAGGRIQSAGPIAEVITADNLSEAFGLRLEVSTSDTGRFAARAV